MDATGRLTLRLKYGIIGYMMNSIGNEELLKMYGDHQLNEFRTIQQTWARLNSTPYHTSKAPQYSMLRQLMLNIHKEGGSTDGEL